jgi:hypothetical protein
MGRRLTTGTDPDRQITDEMLAAEPPIHDDVKITATLIGQIRLVADAVDADGARIVELLGAPADGGPPEWDHSIADEHRRELVEEIDELLVGIEAQLDVDGAILDAASDVRPSETSSVEQTTAVSLHVYRKLWTIRRLVGFADDHDIQFSIG